MRFFVGTSGYSYKEWKGSFYPEKLPQKDMLSYYAQRFSTVEINNTFYRMPKASMLESWAAQVPEEFRFVIKAPQRITHIKRLKDAEQDTDYLLGAISVLKGRLGPVLFQLPPNLKKDMPRLVAFLDLIPEGTQAAWEFRHESWLDEEVFDCLRAKSAALCIADVDEAPTPELVSTARWGYVRLRSESYTDDQLVEWIGKLRSQPWGEAYVFFKHEDAGVGAKLGARFVELAGQ
ncbi:MAG: DUF72 domain-containing protein [Planctomycetes bacterium]|nr:DUF72 domain-containing protein [Planctomycetota bacterium]